MLKNIIVSMKNELEGFKRRILDRERWNSQLTTVEPEPEMELLDDLERFIENTIESLEGFEDEITNIL